MTVTYTQIHQFLTLASFYLGQKDVSEGKFTYAVRKMQKAAAEQFADYEALVDDARIMHAVEQDGKLLKAADGKYEYNREGLLALNKAIRAANLQRVEIAPFLVAEDQIPASLTVPQREAFEGWVIPSSEQDLAPLKFKAVNG